MASMLASVDDVAARLGRPVPEDECPRVVAFIQDASALVEDFCKRTFEGPVPQIVCAVICAEVIRWLAVSPGVSSERVGDLEVEYTGASTLQTLSPASKSALSKYRRKLSVIPLAREEH